MPNNIHSRWIFFVYWKCLRNHNRKRILLLMMACGVWIARMSSRTAFVSSQWQCFFVSCQVMTGFLPAKLAILNMLGADSKKQKYYSFGELLLNKCAHFTPNMSYAYNEARSIAWKMKRWNAESIHWNLIRRRRSLPLLSSVSWESMKAHSI